MFDKLVFLGTAQDAGIPHMDCTCSNCERFERRIASIGLVAGNIATLLDVTPDVGSQIRHLSIDHMAVVNTIYLTHAHWGHYGGLPLFGRESNDVKGLKLFGTDKMHQFLIGNEPFSSLIKQGNFTPQVIEPLDHTEVSKISRTRVPGIQAIKVKHREEYTDTVAFMFDLNGKNVLYMPDVDQMTVETEELIRTCDISIIDGTFFSKDEIKAREITEIPHPFVNEVAEKLLDVSEKIIFTHFNHTNPLVDPNSSQSKRLIDRGYRLASDGEVLV